jgi:hypothetical protein
MRTEWCPHRKDIIATGSEDKLLAVWNISNEEEAPMEVDGEDG